MNRKTCSWVLAATIASACLPADASRAQAQPAKAEPATHPGQAAPPATKGETPQQFLAKRAGEYTRTIRFVGAPDSERPPSTGTSKITVILDGRFIEEQNEDVVFGRPVSGTRIYGYNNATKQYEAVWMYTMSPAILNLTGTSTDGGKVVDYTGVTYTGNGGKSTLRARMRQVDNDQFVITLYTVGADGKDSAFQETTYQRKK
ncbi:MAG TPA: DUF1579 family protein [Candidatus Acidoferrales bacterium]|nr:DUF1579 family protein [Candidatus Acidoferrales bacterium]